MKLFDSSSGDAIADKRADYAEMLFQSGDATAAADLMLQALERAPAWTYGWFRLGEMQAEAGDTAGAAEAWRMAQKLDPEDRLGAALKLDIAGQGAVLATMPPAFVETLFDQYAGKFENSLVGKLDYRAPDLLLDAILAVSKGPFACAIDLGCGTGLMGERLRPLCAWLEGYDLSEGMLREARAKNIYDRLEQADIAQLRPDGTPADLVVAADVYMYLGALEAAFASAGGLLGAGGLFAFSVEALDATAGFRLRDTRRFAHSEAYVREVLESSGLHLVSLFRATIRQDRNAPVEGLIVVAAK